MMNFSKISFQYATVLRSTIQSGRKKALKDAFNMFKCSICRRQQLNVHALMTTLRSKANTMPLLRRIESRLGIIEPRLGNFEPCLGIIEPRLGRIEPCFGIIKAVNGLNTKPNLGNVFRAYQRTVPIFGNFRLKNC